MSRVPSEGSNMLPRPVLREEFRARLRADLMNEAAAVAEERRARRPSVASRVLSWWSVGRMRPVAVAAMAVVVLLAGTGAAAAGSVPGDAAYPLKRAVEEIEVSLAADPASKVEVLTRQAERRLDDLSKAASRTDKAPTASSEYEAAVQRLAAAVAALRTAEPGQKRDAVEQVVEAARDKHVQVLEQLRDRLPADAQKGIDRALEEHGRLSPRPGTDKEKDRGKDGPRGGGRPSALPTRP